LGFKKAQFIADLESIKKVGKKLLEKSTGKTFARSTIRWKTTKFFYFYANNFFVGTFWTFPFTSTLTMMLLLGTISATLSLAILIYAKKFIKLNTQETATKYF
jgi:hypothetical protein